MGLDLFENVHLFNITNSLLADINKFNFEGGWGRMGGLGGLVG